MRGLRPTLMALAIALATLPSPAAAATPNQLLDPNVSPRSGSTATAFAFGVRYVSEKGWPALSVSASVAGKTVALKRTSGTASDGTWSASVMLPAGTWPVTFSADAEQGPDPSVAGPSVAVSVAATPAPKPAATPQPAAPTPQPAAPTPQPAAPTPVPAATEATPVPTPSASGSPVGAPTPGSATPSASLSATPSPTMSLTSPQSGTATTRRATPTAEPAGTTNGGRTDEADGVVLAIVGLTMLILGIAGLVLLWDRRRSASAAMPEPASSLGAAVEVEETARARSRRPRLDPIGPEDPILAAMGVGNERRKES